MNDVAPLVQMKLPSANDVMLRINEVALRANGAEPLVYPSKRCDLDAKFPKLFFELAKKITLLSAAKILRRFTPMGHQHKKQVFLSVFLAEN